MSVGRESRRRDRGGLGPETARLLLALAVIGVAVAVWGALTLGSLAAGDPVNLNPTAAVLELLFGNRGWPWQSSAILATESVLVAVVVVPARRRGTRSVSVDAAARTMQRPRELRIGRVRDNAAQAGRLLKDAPPEVRQLKGPLLGYTVAGNVALHVPAELGVFIEAGTRTGKTMVWAIPAVLAAWGPVMATSNRPDLYRHTCAARRAKGRVWLSDPQAVTGTVAIEFWVNLLRNITTLAAARKLASFFVSASKEKDAKVDSYFDGGAQELLALHILAAACTEGDLLHVTDWLGADQDQTPALILRNADKPRAAQRILEAQALYARQRDGLYDMARRFLNVLSDEVYATMVTPPRRRSITAYETGDTITVDNPETVRSCTTCPNSNH
ncbi:MULTISPECIES: type IV secretory system conjugative DNA transfer family protein [Nocardia]|uniref:type IV secretory system conjugative DNA transfer family protein n=1 Tax=Nocardia TaxID=1817 RepID=UPI000D69F945|nr:MULTISPECIES: type IV secretory system conjugative DNA transfer family protein [Nocardia]